MGRLSRRAPPPPLAALCALILLSCVGSASASIGCFVCESINGSNPACEDPFNSSMQLDATGTRVPALAALYHSPCYARRKQRDGPFPADHCIKINGENNGVRMVIRTCALDSGSLTADTEIVRISHCGNFKIDKDIYSGCVQSCDTDGCNGATTVSLTFALALFSLTLALRR